MFAGSPVSVVRFVRSPSGKLDFAVLCACGGVEPMADDGLFDFLEKNLGRQSDRVAGLASAQG